MGIPKISHVCAGWLMDMKYIFAIFRLILKKGLNPSGQNFSVLGLFSSTEIICFGDNKYGQFGTPSAVSDYCISNSFWNRPRTVWHNEK